MCFSFKENFLGIAIVSLFHANIITYGYISKLISHVAVCSLDVS